MSDAPSNSGGSLASQQTIDVDSQGLRSDLGETTELGVSATEATLGQDASFLREIAHIDDAPARAGELIGARLGRFRVMALLGRGGMGVVHRAVDEALRREVALKVLPAAFADDEERRRRFLREARSAAAVSHPSIATVYEVGEAEGHIYIAMELVRGKSLATVLADRRLPVPEALRIARGILDGVRKAHAVGLVHRDLKPDNVMITDDGAVKVLDFGLAKPVEQAMSASVLAEAATINHLTAEGRVMGTPSYMSPEQARGEAVDPRSDVFSFGVMLYEMLAGRRPFAGKPDALVTAAILRDEPVPVSKLNPDVPAELAGIVARCLAKEPAGRYRDGRRLAEALARVGRGGAGARWQRRWLAALLAGAVASGTVAASLGLRHAPGPSAPPAGETVAPVPSVPGPPTAAGVSTPPPVFVAAATAEESTAAPAAVAPPKATAPPAARPPAPVHLAPTARPAGTATPAMTAIPFDPSRIR